MNNIKYFRMEKKLTLTELAKLCNMSLGYLSNLESGARSNPSYKTMKKISDVLGHNVSEIFNI